MVAILGISALYHDSAAALVADGDIVAAVQEERLTRKKHDAAFPVQAIGACLREGAITADDLDYVAFYEKPLVHFDRLIETYLSFAPFGFRSFVRAMSVWPKTKLRLPSFIRRRLETSHQIPLVFLDHHQSHAASAFFPSPFEEAAILTIDGVGEWSTATVGQGRANRIELSEHIQFPHSLGLLYSAFTYYCGFKVNGGEYKLMGLAPYGHPVYREAIERHLVHRNEDGSLWLDMQYFNYCQGLTMTTKKFHALFGGPPRNPESEILQRHMDLAASIQVVLEEMVLCMATHVHAKTGMRKLVMAGGVALNCVANGRLAREGPFEEIWIQPAAGDAGGSIGAALFVWHQLLENERIPNPRDAQKGSFLGPSIADAEIRAVLLKYTPAYEHIGDDDELLERMAEWLADEKIIGWAHDRMEFGPRALGARSILADARSPRMQATLNLKVKYRESFRPFAPVVLAERAADWFELPDGWDSPYMLFTGQVLERHRRAIPGDERCVMERDPDLRLRVNVARSSIPAVTHVDYSARLQTVDRDRNPKLHRLLTKFERITKCPVLVNTSFNVRGEPIVCSAEDAFRCFMATEIDILVIGNYVVRREGLREGPESMVRVDHLAQFQMD
jgi:carbamoyltransferase